MPHTKFPTAPDNGAVFNFSLPTYPPPPTLTCCYHATVNRREFLQTCSRWNRCHLRAVGAPGNIRLGFDTYSLRAFKWNATQFIEYAASQKLDSIQLSSLNDFESFETGLPGEGKGSGSEPDFNSTAVSGASVRPRKPGRTTMERPRST